MKQKTILVSGVFYTGSSAIVDYLLGYGKIFTLRNSGLETGLFYGKYGIHYIYGEIAKHGIVSDYTLGQFNKKALGVFGGGHYDRANRNMVLENGPLSSLAVALFVSKLSLLDAEDGLEKNVKRFSAYLEEFLYDLCRTSVRNSPPAKRDVLLFNNDPAAHHEKLSDMFEYCNDLSIVVCIRDPRDALCDLMAKEPTFKSTESSFDRWLDKQRSAFKWIDELFFKEDLRGMHIVRFEEFVLNRFLREELSCNLGLGIPESHSFFDEDVSKKNIGIHLNKYIPEYDIVASELAEFRCLKFYFK